MDMDDCRRSRGVRTSLSSSQPWRETAPGWGLSAVLLTGALPSAMPAQQAPMPLVLDGVTVIDVERGQRLPEQRVVIVGNRIQALGKASVVPLSQGGKIDDARGKY